ncbi:hypothetical protein PRJ_5067 [Pseudomonas sp. XWY-1]|nr:hypothetical protein PRJ_5067 [Pseudomonas sp. XWY-1]
MGVDLLPAPASSRVNPLLQVLTFVDPVGAGLPAKRPVPPAQKTQTN